jgi:hypothetical protein
MESIKKGNWVDSVGKRVRGRGEIIEQVQRWGLGQGEKRKAKD